MILDEAATLKLLVAQASEAADDVNRDSALATVEDRVSVAQRQLSMYAIARPPWRDLLPEPARDAVLAALSALTSPLKQLVHAGDDELVAYGARTAADERGGLAAIVNRKDELLEALQTAQEAMLGEWLQQLWPADRHAELEVLAHLPEGQRFADEILATLRALATESEFPQPLAAERMERLKQRIDAAQALAEQLAGYSVPEAVVHFWRAASDDDGDGTSLSTLSLDVHEWLVEHGANDLFAITRR
jgi:hypothetical protein